uniref:uncharacterized protein n=1 Tax=Centroberyx gerrardi TaxID=166262 RepID=UPI003AAB7F2A
MEVSSQDPSPMAMDLSKGYSVNPLTRSHTEAMDLAKKPEWYHRRPPSCSTEVSSPYRTRSRATSNYNSLSTRIMDSSIGDGGVIQLHPEAAGPVHCRDMEPGPESLGNYMNSTLAQGLGLYHEGVHGNLWHPGFYRSDQTGGQIPESSGGEESDSGSDVIFLVSSAKDSLLCSSFMQESVSHIVEPLSPAAPSLDEGRGCYLLPQPLSSPSPDSTYSEDSSDSSADIPVHHTRPIVLLSDLSGVYGNPVESPVDISSDDSDVIEVSVTNEKKKSHNFPGKTPCKKSLVGDHQSDTDEPQPRELRRSTRIRKSPPEMPKFTPSVSQHNLRSQVKNARVGLYNECYDSDDVMEFTERLSSSEAESVLQPNLTQRDSSHSDDSDTDTQTDSKRPSKSSQSESSHAHQPRRKASYVKTVKRKQKKPLSIHKTKTLRTEPKARQRIPSEQHPKVSGGSKASGNKSAATKRRRKRRTQTGPSALFSPREPEIKLKYASFKEEKKDSKSDGFRPFIHMERRLCTVVNYQEEEATVRCSRGQHPAAAAAASLSGFVPKTSCFQPGRLSSESKCRPTQVCCLCGQTASVMGLGDLHGPYYPAGPPLPDCQSQRQNCTAPPPEERQSRQKEEEKLQGLNNSHAVNSTDECCDGDGSTVPSVKSPLGSDSVPKVPLHPDECWIHEDCGIWSAGVFLVRGKLYGLGEAARLAQGTVCSTCQQTGAIMGCFQKGCPRNYHYRCATQSGCVLNEDNFSMRCPEHKNKLFTSVTRQSRR